MPVNYGDELMRAYADAGGVPSAFYGGASAHMAVHGSDILGSRLVPGLTMTATVDSGVVSADLRVSRGRHIEKPVLLCFAVLHKTGRQQVRIRITVEDGARVAFASHCLFPNAADVHHVMDGVMHVGRDADMHYSETHYHGAAGGVVVTPKAAVTVGHGGRYLSRISLLSGRAGLFHIDYDVCAGEHSVAELEAALRGGGTDSIIVRERLVLDGYGARGLIKSRVAVSGDARATVTGITEGRGPMTRGHVDCLEILKDRAIARAIPVVIVSDETAKVTHEAAIGSVDRRQMETLMARGLSPDEAVAVIVNGILQ